MVVPGFLSPLQEVQGCGIDGLLHPLRLLLVPQGFHALLRNAHIRPPQQQYLEAIVLYF